MLLVKRGLSPASVQALIDAAERRVAMLAVAVTLTDNPAALTELQSPRFRALVDLTTATTVRLLVNVSAAGVAGNAIRLQWAATEAGPFTEFQPTDQPSVTIDATGIRDSGWIDVPATAKDEVVLRIATVGGNGVVDPVIGRTEVLIR